MGQTILIAEDDMDIVELLSLYLSGEGYRILSAVDGQQALALMETQKVDLAILDIMMPGMNGYDLLREIRKHWNLPVLILSAKDLDTDKILGLNLGADAYITKPFHPLEVVAYVKAALRRYCQLGGEGEGGRGSPPPAHRGPPGAGPDEDGPAEERGGGAPHPHGAENCRQTDGGAGAGVHQGPALRLHRRGAL